MNPLLRPYLCSQTAYSEMEKQTGFSEDYCRNEIEGAWNILNPTGDIILYPERLPWHLIK